MKNKSNKRLIAKTMIKREKNFFKNVSEKIQFTNAIVQRQTNIKKLIKIIPIKQVQKLIKMIDNKIGQKIHKPNNYALSLMPKGTINPGVENKHKKTLRQKHYKKRIIKLPTYHEVMFSKKRNPLREVEHNEQDINSPIFKRDFPELSKKIAVNPKAEIIIERVPKNAPFIVPRIARSSKMIAENAKKILNNKNAKKFIEGFLKIKIPKKFPQSST